MSKFKPFLAITGIVIAILLIFVGCIALYCWLPSFFIGREVLENSIHATNASTSAPKNYRASFATWEYVVNDSTGQLDKVLVNNAQNQGLSGVDSLINLGIITEDGSYGRHVRDIADYKNWLLNNSTRSEDREILYIINLLEMEGTTRQKSYNIANLAIAVVANTSNEGKPFYWEGTSKWVTAEANKGNFYEDVGNERRVKNGATTVPIATKNGSGWYVTTAQQLENLHALGSNHVLYDASLGCGSVQWTNGRCWKYIKFMYEKMSDGELDMTSQDSIKYWDSAFMLEELDSYMGNYLNPSDPAVVCIETLAGWVAAVYECPQASCAFHYNRTGYAQQWYTDSGKSGTITSKADFYDGTIKDFSEQHKWVSGGAGATAISESTRIRDAISYYDRYNQ